MENTGMIEIITRVRMAETDLMQVAHHANYFRWFEMARVEYLRARGLVLKDLRGSFPDQRGTLQLP
jgi:acyl-CoA thioester hydrolase